MSKIDVQLNNTMRIISGTIRKKKEKELQKYREGKISEAVVERLGLFDRAQGVGNAARGSKQTFSGTEKEVRVTENKGRQTQVGNISGAGVKSTGAINKTSREVLVITTDTSGDEGLARARGVTESEGEWETIRRKKTFAEALARDKRGGVNKRRVENPTKEGKRQVRADYRKGRQKGAGTDK